MNLIGAFVLLLAITLVLSGSRSRALLGMMVGVLFLTEGQQIEIAGFNLYAFRFVELAGFARVMVRREFSFARLNRIDRTLLLLYACETVAFVVRSTDSLFNQLGTAVDAFLCYFAFRGLVGELDDFRSFLRTFLILLCPYVLLLLYESFTGKNPFFMAMGGAVYGDWMRGSRPRCLGSFRHPSLLGTLGATFFPLYIGLAYQEAMRKYAWLGMFLCLAIVWAANSGSPLCCLAVGVAGWFFWRVRTKMKLVRWIMLVGVVILALTMEAPIWYLPAKVSMITGGDGWHRSYLLDVAFRNFDKWWLLGMSLRDTNGWFPYNLTATGGADITNQFLYHGLMGGILAIILFIALLCRSFGNLGKALALIRAGSSRPSDTEYFLWGLGVMLAAHMFNWLGTAYFDQTYAIWFLQLAAISNISEGCIHSAGIVVSREIFSSVEAAGNEAVGIGLGPAEF